MTVSRDSLLFACVIGTEDDPIPVLRGFLHTLPEGHAFHATARAAMNELTDAEVHIRLACSADAPLPGIPNDFGVLLGRQARAVETLRGLLDSVKAIA